MNRLWLTGYGLRILSMLQQTLSLFHQANGIPLSAEMVARQLGLPTAVVEQLLLTLVQRGRLVLVDQACNGCPACPLKVVCAGAPALVRRGYALAAEEK